MFLVKLTKKQPFNARIFALTKTKSLNLKNASQKTLSKNPSLFPF